jgi:hypothetical protein
MDEQVAGEEGLAALVVRELGIEEDGAHASPGVRRRAATRGRDSPKVGAYRPGRVSFLRWTWKIALRFRADRAVSARG